MPFDSFSSLSDNLINTYIVLESKVKIDTDNTGKKLKWMHGLKFSRKYWVKY